MNKEISLFTRFRQLNTLYKFLGRKKYSYITLVTINQCTGLLGNLGIGIAFNLLINGLLEKKTELFIQCWVFIAVLFTFILTLFPYLSFKTAMFSKRIMFDLRKELYAKLNNIEYRDVSQSRQNIYINLTSDVESLSSFFNNTLPEIIFCLVYFLGTFLIMLYLNALIVAIILVSALVIFYINNRYSQKIDESNQNIKERNEEVVETYHQTQSAIRTIKIYLLESKVIPKFSQTINNMLGEKRKQVKLFNRQGFFSGILTDISGWGSYLIGAVFVSLGMMNLGNVVLFAQVQNGVLNLFNSMPNLLNGISNTIVSYERIRKFTALDNKEQPETTCNMEIVPGKPAIQVEDISFSYDKIAAVLSEAILTIQKGSTNAIIARNGSGKSTFMRLLTRLMEPDRGIIRIFGTDISRCDTSGLRSMIHYVEQDPYLFTISVKDSICLGNKRTNITNEEVKQAARLACIHDRIMEMPAQYDTILDKREINLSKGERQRIALARMFLSNAELVVLDEAMSAIDAGNASRIVENIKRNEGKTIIYICHDIAAMPDVDYVYYLNDGRFVMLDKGNIGEDEFLKSFYTLYGKIEREVI